MCDSNENGVSHDSDPSETEPAAQASSLENVSAEIACVDDHDALPYTDACVLEHDEPEVVSLQHWGSERVLLRPRPFSQSNGSGWFVGPTKQDPPAPAPFHQSSSQSRESAAKCAPPLNAAPATHLLAALL